MHVLVIQTLEYDITFAIRSKADYFEVGVWIFRFLVNLKFEDKHSWTFRLLLSVGDLELSVVSDVILAVVLVDQCQSDHLVTIVEDELNFVRLRNGFAWYFQCETRACLEANKDVAIGNEPHLRNLRELRIANEVNSSSAWRRFNQEAEIAVFVWCGSY